MSETATTATDGAGAQDSASPRQRGTQRDSTPQPTRFSFEQLQPSAPPDPSAPGRLIELAQAKAQEIRRRAWQEGFEHGRAEGAKEGAAAAAAATQALGAALRQIEQAGQEMTPALERDAVDLSLALASKIVAGALQAQPQRVLDVIGGALRHIADRRRITVLVDPEDLEIVTGAIGSLSAQAGGIELCEVQSDRRVGRGGAIVRTIEGEVDASIATQLERAREVVATELGGTPDDSEALAADTDADGEAPAAGAELLIPEDDGEDGVDACA